MWKIDRKGNMIHETAIIHESAKIGRDNHIGPGVIIGKNVTMGDRNKFLAYATIGSPAEHKKEEFNWVLYEQKGQVLIGDNNTFREFITINMPTVKGEKTQVGNNCYIMRGCHISHDSIVEDDVVMSCDVILGGHSRVMKGAYMGIKSCTHPHKVVGSYCIAGMGAIITKSFPPGLKLVGIPAKDKGFNEIGLERANLAPGELDLEVDRFMDLIRVSDK